MTSPTRSEHGFTLIEMLVVLVILGLTAGLVLARGSARSAGLDLRAQASEIAQSLRVARSRAIATNGDVTFALDVTARRFAVDGGPIHLLPAQMQVAIITVGPAGRILFAPDGSASGGRITLAEGASTIVVGVDWLTGRVSVGDGS